MGSDSIDLPNYSYDALKRLTQVTRDQGGSGPQTTNTLTGYGYDVADRLTRVTDPNSGTTTYVYDDLGNLLSRTSPDTGFEHHKRRRSMNEKPQIRHWRSEQDVRRTCASRYLRGRNDSIAPHSSTRLQSDQQRNTSY